MGDWNPKANEIFLRAAELRQGDDRQGYLRKACGGDAELRAQVERLLQAGDVAGSFLESRPAEVEQLERTAKRASNAERPGTVIGPYKLMEQIGEGGFGLVFVAEQQRPVRRKVALKIIKPGMDSREVIARFEAERQALALMDHPNIAQVWDAGTTAAGRPYFVMELVKGIEVIQYCEQQELTVRERLELFVMICRALQHAHQKGVIHRDLKPSNILVAPHDGVPVVKVIDFGIAKAIGQQLTEKTIYTAFAQMLGTPLYMSPEQAEINALDVDTRSDVYSLGVLLYELLTGTTPFDRQRFATAAYDEIRRIIKEEEPPRPSVRLSSLGETLSTVSAKRKLQPAKLHALIRGDLDWIVMKSLEKDRTRRYETALSMADDVQRYLNDEAVVARPPSAVYRIGKMARRNKAAFVATAVVFLGLVGSLTVALYSWGVAELQREVAVREQGVATMERGVADQQRRLAEQHRQRAESEAAESRRLLYSADVALAQMALRDNSMDDVLALLLRHYPRDGRSDMRSFEWYYLWNQCSRAIRTPQLRLSDLGISGAFSPDGARFAVGEDNSRVEEFDMKSGELRVGRELAQPSSSRWVMSTAYSPNGRYLAVPRPDGDIVLYNQETGREEPLKGHKANVNALAFSPDSRVLCSGGDDKRVIVWDVQSKAPRPVSHDHKARVYAVTFSPDGELLASVDSDGHLIVSRVDSPSVPRELTSNAFEAPYGGGIAFSLDGKLLACATDMHGIDQVMVIDADPAAGNEPTIRVFGRHDDQIRSVTFIPSDASPILATGSRDNSIKLWNVDSGTLIDTLRGHSGFIQDLAVSRDGSTLASVGRDYRVRLWDLRARRSRSLIDFEFDCVDVAPLEGVQGTLVLGSDGVIRRVNLVSGTVSPEEFGTTRPQRMAVSSNGKWMLKVGKQGMECVNLEAGSAKHFPFAGSLVPYSERNPVALSIDGERFAVVSTNGTIYFGDTRHGIRHEIDSPHTNAGTLAFNATGSLVASADLRGVVCVWDVETGARVNRLTDGNMWVEGLAFSSDGQWLVTGCGDNLIRIWDLNRYNRPPVRLAGHTGPVKSFLFADGEGTLISAAGDGQIITWDLDRREKRFVFATEANFVAKLAWLDGQSFVSLSGPRLRVWESSTKEEVLADLRRIESDDFPAHESSEISGAFGR